MTYREAIDRYIKNDVCKRLLLYYLKCILDNAIEETQHGVLHDLFYGIIYIRNRHLSINERNYEKIFIDQIFHLVRNMERHKVTHIHEWKSIPEWLNEINNETLKKHSLFLYDEIISKYNKHWDGHLIFDRFKSHNISTAVDYLYDKAFKSLERKVVYSGCSDGECHQGNAEEYFYNSIHPVANFIIKCGRPPNDFDDFGE